MREGGGRERRNGVGWIEGRKSEERERERARLVNRNYEAARLRICRAGSKRCVAARESATRETRPRDVDVLDHRREYAALRFCRRAEHVCTRVYVCTYILSVLPDRGKIKFLGSEFAFLDHLRPADDLAEQLKSRLRVA